MPKTKLTPVKKYRCPICSIGFVEEKAWSDHLIICGREKMEKQSFVCTEDGCGYATSKKSDLNRHIKRKHAANEVAHDDSESNWEEQDPGELSDIVGRKPVKPVPAFDLIPLGRVIRKPTTPSPVFAPPRSRDDFPKPNAQSSGIATVTSAQPSVAPADDQESDINNNIDSSASIVSDKVIQEPCVPLSNPIEITFPFMRSFCQDAATQTDLPQRRHKRKRIVRSEDNGRVEEVISEEEWCDY
ncbi:hypothetical protein FSP39_025200 [Pinctada imbricata]|uniref:C2H2-type domain-containing protein n=1 Tax=Pinctada imbricata TaxID=66713 RepID=A0AA88YLT1_PINIB|nr:hypothetical protein FSP39_025200 [Pinctada imbricata]